jgi:hypothetical protein
MGIRVILAAATALLAAGCSDAEREWLKLNQPYTAAEFRQDIAACTRAGKLDEDCMKSRGWVSLSPAKVEKPQEPVRAPSSPRYR